MEQCFLMHFSYAIIALIYFCIYRKTLEYFLYKELICQLDLDKYDHSS